MLTYTGEFDLVQMVAAMRPYIKMHLNKNNKDEAEVPFENADTKEVRYAQFICVGGNWVFVRTRK